MWWDAKMGSELGVGYSTWRQLWVVDIWISEDREYCCDPRQSRRDPRCGVEEVLARMNVASLEQLSGRASDFAEFDQVH